ncbi:hypothetical protein AEA42_05335 [Shewanella sp. Sh95]|nr:hypothetical protein AEA42_05335 [Shewanella sp. Sh95]
MKTRPTLPIRTAVYRCMLLISLDEIELRENNGQVDKTLTGVKVMNKVIGMLIRQRVNEY